MQLGQGTVSCHDYVMEEYMISFFKTMEVNKYKKLAISWSVECLLLFWSYTVILEIQLVFLYSLLAKVFYNRSSYTELWNKE